MSYSLAYDGVFQVIIVYISVAFVTNETYTKHVTKRIYNQQQSTPITTAGHK